MFRSAKNQAVIVGKQVGDTVLVLGAGASMHLGYPLGSGLVEQIKGNSGNEGCAAFKQLRDMGFGRGDILEFHSALVSEGSRSIDDFLSTHEESLVLGRATIAQVLIGHEDPIRLAERDNWYWQLGWYFRESFRINEHPPAIVTFNYDRSLDKFIHDAIKGIFPKSFEYNRRFIRIAHVHGRLDYLDSDGITSLNRRIRKMRDKNSKMPGDVGAVYDGLCRELSWFSRTLEVLYGVYLDKPENVAILNDVAPDFFGFLQNTLIDSLIVSLSRMIDNESSGENKNLSFSRLSKLIDTQAHAILKGEVESSLMQLRQCSKAARDHRNKRVAHADLDVALKSQTLPHLLIVDFRKSLEVAHRTLNHILVYFDHCKYSERVAPAPGNYESLLFAIRRAHESKQSDSFKYYMGIERQQGSRGGTAG